MAEIKMTISIACLFCLFIDYNAVTPSKFIFTNTAESDYVLTILVSYFCSMLRSLIFTMILNTRNSHQVILCLLAFLIYLKLANAYF